MNKDFSSDANEVDVGDNIPLAIKVQRQDGRVLDVNGEVIAEWFDDEGYQLAIVRVVPSFDEDQEADVWTDCLFVAAPGSDCLSGAGLCSDCYSKFWVALSPASEMTRERLEKVHDES